MLSILCFISLFFYWVFPLGVAYPLTELGYTCKWQPDLFVEKVLEKSYVTGNVVIPRKSWFPVFTEEPGPDKNIMCW